MNNEALPTFLTEARELSESIETALLALEAGDADDETIHSLFRAMHTIKGSAGLFGLAGVVEFAHVVETVLTRARDAQIVITPELVGVLIECHDHLNHLLAAVEGEEYGADELNIRGARLVARLEKLAGSVPLSNGAGHKVPVSQQLQAAGEAEFWHVSMRFMPGTLRNGTDPLAVVNYLGTIGRICALQIIDEALPAAAEFDAENCYLGFECRLETQADRARIESAFEFVRDDSLISILPPSSRIADYVRLVQELPESEARLGEILVRCGSITQHELDAALALQKQLAQTTQSRPLGEILIEQRLVPQAVVEAAVEKQRTAADSRRREQRSMRVDTQKLEALFDLVSELVTEGAQTRYLAQRAQLAELNESSSRLARLLEQVREQTLKLSMVPIGSIFARFARLVRDDARELGKQIALHTHGADTELDKTLVEQISDPLTHLVRNSIDHGIESVAARIAKGKPAQGTVRLNAYHDSGSVVIEVSDDGGGLDRDRILAKGIERGLATPGQKLSDGEVFALIFSPGFSTAETVTNLSGRGVGMDVVKRNVNKLRGSIDIESTAGVGTTVRIRLPLTLAIIEGFLVRVAGSAFVIPLEMVEECVETSQSAAMLDTGHQYIDLRGAALPFVRLREHFSLRGSHSRRESIVVVRCGTRRAGLVVDELLGEHQTVIKPLSRMFQTVRGLGGSTILADGGVALIIDAQALISECGGQCPESRCAA